MDDWFEVGLKLQLSEEALKQIERDYPQQERRKTEMLSRWFQSHPDASYEELIKALASTGNKSVAEELCSKQGKHSAHLRPGSRFHLNPMPKFMLCLYCCIICKIEFMLHQNDLK